MQPKIIDTSKYTRSGKVNVDGKEWEVTLPGAGVELKFSKMQRRINFLTKKVNAGTADESDLDKLDSFEDATLEFFIGVFKDSTEDNSEVKEWVENTPMSIISQAFQDIQKAAESLDEA